MYFYLASLLDLRIDGEFRLGALLRRMALRLAFGKRGQAADAADERPRPPGEPP